MLSILFNHLKQQQRYISSAVLIKTKGVQRTQPKISKQTKPIKNNSQNLPKEVLYPIPTYVIDPLNITRRFYATDNTLPPFTIRNVETSLDFAELCESFREYLDDDSEYDSEDIDFRGKYECENQNNSQVSRLVTLNDDEYNNRFD